MQSVSLPSAFPRSARAIHSDSLYPGLAILITLMVLLMGWVLWLVFFPIPFYETSRSARVTPDAMLVAEFPASALTHIKAGQQAFFLPGSETTSPSGSSHTLTLTVAEVDTRHGRVLLLLPDDPAVHQRLRVGLGGQVSIVVRKQSPLSLLIKAAGMDAVS